MSTRTVNVTIANGTSVSDVVNMQARERIVGVITPGTWTAADIGFQISTDGTNFFNAVDAAGTVGKTFARIPNVAAGAAQYYIVPPTLDFPVGDFAKITSLTAGADTALNQGADRVLTVVLLRTPT